MTKDAARFAGGDNFYEYANDDPVNARDPSGFNTLSWGVNIGGAAGFGVGTGGYLELGIFVGTDPGDHFGFYVQTAHVNAHAAIVAVAAVGISQCLVQSGQFRGPGGEYSVDIDNEYGESVQVETDEFGKPVGFAHGASYGPGAGYFDYETNTYAWSWL